MVVGEPTDLQIVHTHKEFGVADIAEPWKAVHASTPNRGDNAIYKMLDGLNFLRGELEKSFNVLHDDMLGTPTFNVGTIQGGSKVNIVPDFCEARVDMRIIPGQDITPLLNQFSARFPDIEMELRSPSLCARKPTTR